MAIREALAGADRPEHVLLLNSDTIVEPNALAALCEFMDTHPRAGIAGSLLLHPDGTVGPSPFRLLGVATELDRGLRVGFVHHLLARWVDSPHPTEDARVDWVSGASMLLRTAMLEEVGLLDEGFFAYYEDIDLCVRARAAGWETWYVPGSRVFHLEGGLSGFTRKAVRRPAFFYQARRRFFLKHRGPVGAAIIDAAFLTGLVLHALRSVVEGRSSDTWPAFMSDSFRYSVFGSGFRLEAVEPPRAPASEVVATAADVPAAAAYEAPTASNGNPRSIVRRALNAVPLAFWERAFPKDVVGLCYHLVSDDDLAHAKLYPYKNAAQFEADVEWGRPRALTYEQVARRRLSGKGLRQNGLFFSFDDGFAECFDVARPILLRHGVDATFFVTGDFLDDRRLFAETRVSLCLGKIEGMAEEHIQDAASRLGLEPGSSGADAAARATVRARLNLVRLRPGLGDSAWRLASHALQFGESDDERLDELCHLLGVDVAAYAARRAIFLSREQVRTLHSDGFTIGAHAMRHLAFQGASEAEIEREIVESCATVRDVTGQPRIPFAFPYGAKGISRTFLAGVRARNDFVDLIFDAEGIERDAPFVVQRLWSDIPSPSGGQETNLPEIIRRGFARRAAWYRDAP